MSRSEQVWLQSCLFETLISGFGGGYNDRQNVEYIERNDDDEFDEFGRRKRKKTQVSGIV